MYFKPVVAPPEGKNVSMLQAKMDDLLFIALIRHVLRVTVVLSSSALEKQR